MNKQPRLMRPLAQSQYQRHGMMTLLQWLASQIDESSRGACTLSPTSIGFLNFTSVNGWLEIEGLITRRLRGSSTPFMLPLSEVRSPSGPSPQLKTLSLPLWFENIAEFDYRWDIVKGGAFQRNAKQREAVTLWLAKHIVADSNRAEWVTAPQLGIQKATLNFVAKFFCLLVRNRVSPTKVDNQLT
ncbi:hypothetical protein H5410_023675 [Solanum commersonii]|uniref:Uncharacterized protein n=1 Tax=Solanum commersonii TaxID=4109 RepID=A0A9J5ZI49_SOLCO|nr:hypothetical protein H5410_023675 [Solanum commersonii]